MPVQETIRKRESSVIDAERVVLATRLSSRLRGLLCSAPSNDLLLLLPCRDIHTFGMSYAIDVAFLDSHGVVVRAQRDVLPNRRLREPAAVAVLERYAVPRKEWLVAGDAVSLSRFQKIELPDEMDVSESFPKDDSQEERGGIR